MRGILTLTFLLIPAISFGYNNADPNLASGFSDQGQGVVDIGAHAPTLAATNLASDLMSALSGVYSGNNSKTSGVNYEKQASRSLTRVNSKGQVIKDGDIDETTDGKDIIQ